MLATLPAPPPRDTIATWNPRIKPLQSAFLLPSLNAPHHSLTAIRKLLDAIKHAKPELIIITGSLFAQDLHKPDNKSSTPESDALSALVSDFLEPLSKAHAGTIWITERHLAIRAATPAIEIATILTRTTSKSSLTKLSSSLAVVDNVPLNSPYTAVPGNLALTLAQALKISVISGSSGRQGRGTITRLGRDGTSVSGIELGTLADISHVKPPLHHGVKNGYASMDLLEQSIELIELPGRRNRPHN